MNSFLHLQFANHQTMANNYFKFKKFTIRQDKCAMKVGTDGVALGAWASVKDTLTILDIGTGTGLIALMLAQRCHALIHAIDIDEETCAQAKENISTSPFADQIRVWHNSFDTFTTSNPMKYDLIISNPPYFNRSLKNPDAKRAIARHTDTLSFTDIIEKGKKMLTPQGRIALIIPFEQEKDLIDSTEKHQMFIIRQTNVFPTQEAKPKRILVELASTTPTLLIKNNLIIEISRHQYTEVFKTLTKDFYL